MSENECCPFCGECFDGWIDITEEVTYKPSVTSTQDKWGYIALLYRNVSIGSIGTDGVKIYKTEHMFSAKGDVYIDVKISDAFKIATKIFDGKPFYFKIYLKRDVWEKLT